MSKKLKPSSCLECPLYDVDIFVPGGFTTTDVVVMSDCPPSFGGHFTAKGESLLKGVIKQLAEEEKLLGREQHLQKFKSECQYMYSTLCHSESLKKDQISYCRDTQVMQKLMASKAKVVLCMGPSLATFFDLSRVNEKDLRGLLLDYRLPNGKTIKLVFSVSIKHFLKCPGIFSVLAGDIRRAAKSLSNIMTTRLNIWDLEETYDICTELEGIKEISREYSSYTNGKPISQTIMSLDTETNTLFPWWKESKIISLSAGFGDTKACSFLVDHKEAAFSLEEVLPYVLKITCSSHPKTWWNFKYDLQMFMALFRNTNFSKGLISDIERETGIPFSDIHKNFGILNTRWDGILGEHLLDEDKKGWYSLKSVIADYKYELYGYEDTLDEAKVALEKEKTNEVAKELETVTLGSLVTDVKSFSNEVKMSELQEQYSELKYSVTRKAKRAKNTGNDRLLVISNNKLELLKQEYKEVASEAKKGLKKLSESYFVKRPKRAGQPTLYTYEDIDTQLLLLYGAIDADGTADICLEQRRRLRHEDLEGSNPYSKSSLTLMDRHCLPLTTVLATIQTEGVFTCPVRIRDYTEKLTSEINSTKDSIYATLEEDFPFIEVTSLNLKSSQSIGNILLGYYGLPVLAETETGLASFTEEVLKQYAEDYKNKVAIDLTTYSKLLKARDTFITGLDTLSGYDQRLHGNINLNGACTGRSSSSSPNLQNIPEKIRNYIIKSVIRTTPIEDKIWEYSGISRDYYMSKYGWEEGEKLVMVDADLSGAEVKVMSRFAPDEALIKALNDGLDAHSWITSEIHGVSYSEIEAKRKLSTEEGKRLDALRQGTKGVVFKILYGGEPEDQGLKELIFRRFPGIPEYLERIKTEVYENGKVYTPNGRCRRFPMVRISDWAARRMYRQAINFGIQSYCSDIVLNMLNNIFNTLHDIRGRLLLTVHDSVVFECPEKELHRLSEYLEKNITMHIANEFPDIPVAMPFSFKVGKNYGEMVSLEKWHKESTTKEF
jgi:DNA polymerase I-like protein with 3'-5' exonuclease and polymerase domains